MREKALGWFLVLWLVPGAPGASQPLPEVPAADCIDPCIANASFEGYTCPAALPPVGWKRYYYFQTEVACSHVAYSSFAPPHSGLSVARFADHDEGTMGLLSSPVIALPGETFEAALWYRAFTGGTSGIYLQFYEPPGVEASPYAQGRLLLSVGVENVATTEWQRQNVTATAPHTNDYPFVLAYVLAYSCGPCHRVYYVDDVTIRRV